MAMFMNVRSRKTYLDRRELGVDKCKQLMRFENESVDFLTNEFLPENDETRGKALSPRMRMEILLRYVADPGFQSGVAEDFGVERSTVSKTYNTVMDCILEKADNWIRFPNSVREMNDAKLLWQTRYNLPTVIGALDCTHVEIKKPTIHGDEYINRKGYPSINVQATCDAREMFTSICADWPGSVHDARIWRRSNVREVLSRYDGSACLLGDSGYGISPWLITPFKPAANNIQSRFNRKHASERVVIERVFGQLKKRFPILGNCVRVPLHRVPKVIAICAVLHNVAKHLNDEFEVEEPTVEEVDEEDDEAGQGMNEGPETKLQGQRKRQDMLNFI